MQQQDDPIPSFEQWLAKNMHHLPQGLAQTLQKHSSTIGFTFFWKRYEQLLAPKMYALLAKQYPAVAKADESFAKHTWQVIEHRIFETAEFAWKIVQSNIEGKHPAEVYEIIYPMALKNMNSPEYGRTIYDETTIPDVYKDLKKETALQLVAECNETNREAINFLNNANKEVIAVLQDDLLELLPDLTDMSPDWWVMYKFLLFSQCNTWRDANNRMDYLISLGMGGEWLDKDYAECRAEMDRIEEKMMHSEA